MKGLAENRLVSTFRGLRAAGRKTLLPFITAGYPDVATTAGLLKDFEARGARVCELGIPFSDPIADGPIIQASYTAALAGGVNSGKVFDMVKKYRAGGGSMALVAMVSYSIVYRHGVQEFLALARGSGFDGLIVPDLPLEEAASLEPLAAADGLCNIMLIAPTTPAKRKLQIASHSRGFIYYVSIAGITGERDRLPPATIEAVGQFRKRTDTPVCVGFGISNAATVAEVCRVADGAIVGSAIVHRIADAVKAGLGGKGIAARAGQFVSELLAPLI